jgi:hypothetical protein
MSLSAVVLLANLMLDAAAVSPACECFCIDGSLKTLCTSLEAAAERVDRCAGRIPARCPIRLEVDAVGQYAAPVAGAENCRDAHVYDPGAGQHRAIRVCDVAPAGPP